MRRPISQLPHHHRDARGRFPGVSEDGVEFELDVSSGRKRAGSGQLVRNYVRAASRGMPLTSGDLYEDVTEIALFVGRGHRQEVRVNANGTYSVGRLRPCRSLRDAVSDAVAASRPRQVPAAPSA